MHSVWLVEIFQQHTWLTLIEESHVTTWFNTATHDEVKFEAATVTLRSWMDCAAANVERSARLIMSVMDFIVSLKCRWTATVQVDKVVGDESTNTGGLVNDPQTH
jgi:hypothetical protein